MEKEQNLTLTLAASKSLRSMPSRRGIEPTRKAASMSLKAVASSVVATTPSSSGKAQSLISITTPSRTPCIMGISNR